jgi:hypothetical protein
LDEQEFTIDEWMDMFGILLQSAWWLPNLQTLRLEVEARRPIDHFEDSLRAAARGRILDFDLQLKEDSTV